MTEVEEDTVKVPQLEPEQPLPERFQATPLFSVSFCKEAVKVLEVKDWTGAEEGMMDTEIGGGGVVMAMVAEADLVPSAMEVAERRTEGGLGAEAGAVKVTESGVILVSVPQVLPVQPLPERPQRTPLF